VVADNHFVSDFLHLNDESSSFEIAAKPSFQDRELSFDAVSLRINVVIKLLRHFLTMITPDDFVIPELDWGYIIGLRLANGSIFKDIILMRVSCPGHPRKEGTSGAASLVG